MTQAEWLRARDGDGDRHDSAVAEAPCRRCVRRAAGWRPAKWKMTATDAAKRRSWSRCRELAAHIEQMFNLAARSGHEDDLAMGAEMLCMAAMNAARSASAPRMLACRTAGSPLRSEIRAGNCDHMRDQAHSGPAHHGRHRCRGNSGSARAAGEQTRSSRPAFQETRSDQVSNRTTVARRLSGAGR